MPQPTMKAAVYKGQGRVEVEAAPLPSIKAGNELLLQVEGCSICGTDVRATDPKPSGHDIPPGTILGHELSARVVEVGRDVRYIAPGDRVVVEPNNFCGVCAPCKLGHTNHCQNQLSMGVNYNGGFAGYVVTSENVLHAIPGDMPMEIAVFAEPLACVLSGLKRAPMVAGRSVFVIGGGPIALLYVQMLRLMGAERIFLSEPMAYRREFAARLGADVVLNPEEVDVAAAVRDATGGGAEVVFDVVGSQLPTAMEAAARCGTIVAFGFNTAARPQIVQHLLVTKELSVLGSWIAKNTFPDAVRVLQSGRLALADMVTHTLPLKEIHTGLALLRSGEALEVIILPDAAG